MKILPAHKHNEKLLTVSNNFRTSSKPITSSEASVFNIKGSMMFGNTNMGELVNIFFKATKTFCSTPPHLKGFLPVRLYNG